MPCSPLSLATSFASLKCSFYCSLATKMEGNSLREKKTKRKNLNVQHAIISKSLCRKMTKWNCEKSGSTEHWPLRIFFYPFSVEMGGNVFFELNSHLWLITWGSGSITRVQRVTLRSYLPYSHKRENNSKHRPEFSLSRLGWHFPQCDTAWILPQ